jgi:AraC family transcriptional activator of pobA
MNHSIIPFHSLEPNEFFLLEKIEESDKSNFEGFHRHHFYEILWFTEVGDNEKHSIDFKEHTIQNQEVYILTPNQVHTMEIGTKKGFLIAISADFFKEHFFNNSLLFIQPYFFFKKLNVAIVEILSTLIQLIEIEYNGERRRQLLENYLQAFFIHISSDVDSFKLEKQTKVRTILNLVEQHYRQEKEVSFYAKTLNLSVRRTNEIMVENTGLTVKQLIINRTITEAKRSVGFSTHSFKEIAYELGFQDPAYFSKFFKQKTGCTPEEFKKNIIQNNK